VRTLALRKQQNHWACARMHDPREVSGADTAYARLTPTSCPADQICDQTFVRSPRVNSETTRHAREYMIRWDRPLLGQPVRIL
jgi:hypothetical protein